MALYPTAEELLANGAEEPLHIRRSPRSMLGLLSWSFFAFFIVSLLSYFFWDVRIPLPFLRHLSFPMLYIVPIIMGIEGVRRYNDDLYILNDDQITHKGGRLSLHYSVPAIRYVDIRAMTVFQSFTGRIFDFGSLELSTSALDIEELYVEGIRAPDELAKLIEEVRLRLVPEGD